MKKILVFLLCSAIILLPTLSASATSHTGSNSFPQSGSNSGPQSGSNSSPQSGNSVTLQNPLKEDTIPGLFKSVMDAIFIIAIPFFVLAMAFVGFLFVAARGKPEKLTTAKNAFLYAIVGTGVFFGAWVLVTMLASLMRTLGVPI